MIRLIALDIDGTLVGDDSTVSPANRSALAAARDRGVRTALLTGRSRASSLPVVGQVDEGVIVALGSFDGALVELLPSGEVLADHRLPPDAAARSYAVMVEAGLGPEVFTEAPDKPVLAWDQALPPQRWLGENLHRLDVVGRPELDRVLADRPITISALSPLDVAEDCARRMRDELGDSIDVKITFSPRYGGYFSQVAATRATKVEAVKTIMERLGVERPQVLAAGDWLNDVDMLRFAGVGVAMGGSVEAVLSAADWVTASVEDEGVALAVDRYVLRG